jgi:hypothetical protein
MDFQVVWNATSYLNMTAFRDSIVSAGDNLISTVTEPILSASNTQLLLASGAGFAMAGYFVYNQVFKEKIGPQVITSPTPSSPTPSRQLTERELTERELTERVRLMKVVRNIYNKEGCGVCKEFGADRLWFSPYSRGAHDRCIEQLHRHQIEKKLKSVIEKLYATTPHQWDHTAHEEAIKAVEKQLDGRTIGKALKEDGAEKVKLLFDTFGVDAARAYYKKCKRERNPIFF